MPKARTKPLVSIIIATYNESQNISNILESIDNQTYPKIETIVVDSLNTTDFTYKIAKRYTPLVFRYGRERSAQRNYGVQKASGEYVLLLDADMKLSPRVVSECVGLNLDVVIIPEKSYGENYWARCKALERNCYIGDPDIEAARFFKKSLFLKVGGYNSEMISGEDWDLNRRVKKINKAGRIKSYIHHNEGKRSLVENLKKKIYYSKKSDAYIEENISGVKQVLLYIFRPAYFRNWKMLLSDPTHFVGFLIMKSLELGIGGMVILSKPEFWRKIVK